MIPGFPPGTLASSHNPDTCSPGEPGALNCPVCVKLGANVSAWPCLDCVIGWRTVQRFSHSFIQRTLGEAQQTKYGAPCDAGVQMWLLACVVRNRWSIMDTFCNTVITNSSIIIIIMLLRVFP